MHKICICNNGGSLHAADFLSDGGPCEDFRDTLEDDGKFMGQLFDWEGLLGHKRPTDMISIFGALAFHCHYEAEGRSSCPVGAFARGQSTRRLVRRKAALDI
jgi:hypothetical protein